MWNMTCVANNYIQPIIASFFGPPLLHLAILDPEKNRSTSSLVCQ